MRTHYGIEPFLVASPAAGHSLAWRDNADRADETGQPPAPTGGYELWPTVIVRTAMPEALNEIVESAAGRTLTPAAGVPGFWLLNVGSVDEAISVADLLASAAGVDEAYVDMTPLWAVREVPSDPRFNLEWNMRNPFVPERDANLEPVWDAGYTGAGVVVGIVENRWQTDHPDLAAHYNAAASQTGGTNNSHTTAVAGIVGAVANNGMFGSGAAYDAQLSYQLLGAISDQADALAFRNDLNHVKNNSWGPWDTGDFWYLPSVVQTALLEGVATGRGGLGEIYVWAGGNGAASNDRVDYDPYASSRYVIAVGAIGDNDLKSGYSEPGSSLMLVTQSDGGLRSIYSTSVNSGETTTFGGTSAASPLAAGVVATLLQANPQLTWRDMQHVLIRAARHVDPASGLWVRNGAGRFVNYNYGYGAIDAGAALPLALGWPGVADEVSFDSGVQTVGLTIPDNNDTGITQQFDVPQAIRVETVELILNVSTTFLGDLEIVMTSPAGTESILAQRHAVGQDNLVNFQFTSKRCWDENSLGTWSIRIADRAAGAVPFWTDYTLRVHGTAICDGDVDGDGQIALSDLAGLLATFGSCSDEAGFDYRADFDGSTCVDLTDLATLLVNFGGSCQ